MSDQSFELLAEMYDLTKETQSYMVEMEDSVGRLVGACCATHIGRSVDGIDIGVGTGETARRCLDASRKLRLTGIDIERKMIDQAVPKLAPYGDRVHLIEIDALTYLRSVKSQSVGVVVSAMTIHNMSRSDQKALLHEIRRVLVTAGKFINGDKIAFDHGLTEEIILEAQVKMFDVFGDRGRPDLAVAWQRHYEADKRTAMAESDLLAILRETGFHDISISERRMITAISVASR